MTESVLAKISSDPWRAVFYGGGGRHTYSQTHSPPTQLLLTHLQLCHSIDGTVMTVPNPCSYSSYPLCRRISIRKSIQHSLGGGCVTSSSRRLIIIRPPVLRSLCISAFASLEVAHSRTVIQPQHAANESVPAKICAISGGGTYAPSLNTLMKHTHSSLDNCTDTASMVLTGQTRSPTANGPMHAVIASVFAMMYSNPWG